MLLLCAASLFSLGCGSSSGDYVFTSQPSQQTPGSTGNLTFNFVQAQGTFVAPVSTC
jgi:hypothetical protein